MEKLDAHKGLWEGAESQVATLPAAFADNLPLGARWYVVMAHPQREESAVANLQRQGFQTFLPQRLETRRTHRGFQTRLRPLFPRYIFVSLDINRHPWRSINGTYGVSQIVSFGPRPAPVPYGVVETMRDSLGPEGAVIFAGDLPPGSRARLLRGPFAMQLGVLEHLDEKGRVRLLLDILGGKLALTVPRSFVEPIMQS